MEDFLAPFFGDHAEIENHGSFRSLEAELAVHGFHRFDGGKRNLQAKLAAEEDLARFEQGLSFGFLLARTDRAFHFVSHGGSPLFGQFVGEAQHFDDAFRPSAALTIVN